MRRLLRLVDPIAVVGIALSVTLALAVDVWGGASDVESLLAGLIGINITLVVDATARAERRFRLRQDMDSVEWLGSAITPIVEHTKDIAQRYPSSAVTAETRRRFQELATELDHLRAGRISRPRGDYEYLVSGAEHCRQRLNAVTNILPGGAGNPDWWASEIGRRYWRANLAALQRGVAVSRIFIYAELNDGLTALVNEQRSAGVTVGLLARNSIDPALHLNMAIFDDTSAWEARMNADGEIIENLFYLAERDVERLRTMFRRCDLNGMYADTD